MSGSRQTETILRTILEKNTHKEVQASVCLSLGQYLKRQVDNPNATQEQKDKLSKEAEALFERIVKDFKDIQSFAEMAKRELFELQSLAPGKKAPEISGEDLDGKPFKLSDYQGKVVVLDFWGHW